MGLGWECTCSHRYTWNGEEKGLASISKWALSCSEGKWLFRRLCVTISTWRVRSPGVILHHKNKCKLPSQELNGSQKPSESLVVSITQDLGPGVHLLLTASFRYKLDLCWMASPSPRLVSGILLLINYVTWATGTFSFFYYIF